MQYELYMHYIFNAFMCNFSMLLSEIMSTIIIITTTICNSVHNIQNVFQSQVQINEASRTWYLYKISDAWTVYWRTI